VADRTHLRRRPRGRRGSRVTVTVEHVELPEQVDQALAGGALETPKSGAVVSGYGLEIAGWAVGREAAVETIEILHGGAALRSTPPRGLRRDINLRYARRPGADRAGFRMFVNLVGLPYRPQLELRATLANDAKVSLGRISVRRTRLSSPFEPSIHPLSVTTTGRTGSVWLSVLLGAHPEIVTYRPFQTEPRVGAYWLHVLRTLTDPGSYLQAIAPTTMAGNWWVADTRVEVFPAMPDGELESWLRTENVEVLVGFCQARIEGFYRVVARLEGKPAARFFSEKYSPTFVPTMLTELDPNAKEVFLVRDPRDQLASMLAWNRRAGRALFTLGSGAVEDAARHLSAYTQAVLRNWTARQERSLLIRYEDVVSNPSETLTRLFEHVGVDASPETVASVLEQASVAAPGFQRSHRTTPSTEASLGRWRRDIDPSLWSLLDETFVDELEAWYAGRIEGVDE
jgi:hypothetical protein